MIKLKIEVTARDIKRGDPENCFACPIALALHRALRGQKLSAQHVDVSTYQAKVFWKNKKMRADLPKVAQKFIDKFDDREPVEPIEFNIRLRKSSLGSPLE